MPLAGVREHGFYFFQENTLKGTLLSIFLSLRASVKEIRAVIISSYR